MAQLQVPIPDTLMETLKRMAFEKNTTLRSIVSDTLNRAAFAWAAKQAKATKGRA